MTCIAICIANCIANYAAICAAALDQAGTHSVVIAFLLFWRALLAIAWFGTISSTVFLALAIVAGLRNLRLARIQSRAVLQTDPAKLPFVCILKPLYGTEPRLEENLASYFLQDYPAFEIIFGLRTSDDPAADVIDRLRARYPHVPAKIIYSGDPQWPSAKVWSLDKMIASTASQYLIISDSDILVRPDFLRNVMPPLLDPANGLVTCLYRGVPVPDFWSRLEALGMSVEMTSGVVIADMLEGMQFALGPVMALRREALDKCGGIRCAAEYYSDDFVLGNRVHAAGYRVILSHYRVGHVLCTQTFRQTFATQTRWMQSTRYSRPKGHLGSGLTFAVPYGILGYLAATALGHPSLGAALFLWSISNRMLQSVVIGYFVAHDRRALIRAALYPLRDLLGFMVWVASYCGGPTFQWRGELYQFTPGGRIIAFARASEAVPTQRV
jgi:ceramide glucosyltransferase